MNLRFVPHILKITNIYGIKDYDEYRGKKQFSHSHCYKEQDLRERIERKKLPITKKSTIKRRKIVEKKKEIY